MFTAAIVFAGSQWALPALGIGLLAAGVLALSYFRSPAPPALRAACAALKLAGIAMLLLCLLEPTYTGQRAKPGANVLAIVADNSRSLAVKDDGASASRAATLRDLLLGNRAKWRDSLAESFEVRNWLFDSRLQPTADFGELTGEGRASALGAALQSLASRYRGQPFAGIVVLTDGIATDLGGSLEGLGELPPVHPVLIGSDAPVRDIAITGSSVSQTAFEDAPVTVQIEVTAEGYRGRQLEARIDLEPVTNAAAPPVATQTLRVPAGDNKVAFRFQIKPEATGVLFYRASVKAKGEADAAGKDAEESPEATLANNSTVLHVNRGRGPYRILYVSGRPNWEFKFLNRAMVGDDQLNLVGLIRIAKREPKFEFRGRQGESSNPLFRGFGNQSAEETERYDQPVLVRVGTRDEFELRGGFPKTPEDLFEYHAIVVDDLEAEFFTADQMGLIQRFVSERGGGLLMLGGAESFHEGNYHRTALGDALPVYLDARNADTSERQFQLSLTREGWLQPWVRLRSSEDQERGRLKDLPVFDVVNPVRQFKPGATVLATVTDGRTEQPALVTQRFGRGRSAALLVGDFWQSALGDEARMNDLYKAWRQMARWLVADVPGQVEVQIEPAADPSGQSARIEVMVRDAKFQPVDDATVALKITPVSITGQATNAPIQIRAEAVGSRPGVYEASFVSRDTGGYRVEAVASNDQSAEIGRGAEGWTANLDGREFGALKANRDLLAALARKTGGQMVEADSLAAFVRQLPALKAPVTEEWSRPLWNTPLAFLAAVACFVGEWGLRRWKGLA